MCVKQLIMTVLACSFISGQVGAKMEKEISVARFGAVPDDGKNDADALRSAAAYCRTHPGITLYFPPGKYDFRDEQAVRIEREAIGGAYGEDVQGRVFKPDAPYVKAMDLRGCRNLTIKAQGATLVLQGWYEVLSIVNAEDIRVEGLSILYKRPPSTVGRVIASTAESFDMLIDPSRYTYLDSVVTGRVHFYDHVRNRLYTGGASKKELINPALIRVYSRVAPAVGDFCILRHSGHYRPAIMIKESGSVSLKDVKIHSQPGMGVVGHLSKNIVLDNLQVVPEPGNVISTNTDATHFTSCSGTITIENSKFKGQGDDCTNIHNYYYRIYPEQPQQVEIRPENVDLHALSLDYPCVGDTMLVLNRKNMVEQGRYIVQRVDTSSSGWKVRILLDKALDLTDTDHYYMTNLTRFPSVRILNNTVYSHLGRAFLIKSKDIVIAGNSINGSTLTAIKLGAELSWRESGPVENVLIEDNYISGCGYDGPASGASCIMLSTEAASVPPFVNKNIIIRNNIFDTDKKTAILLKDAECVQVLNNRINNTGYIRTENCRDVKVKY